MHNLLRFYNEFSSLASLAGEQIEAKTTASSLGLNNFSDGDIEITLKYVNVKENSGKISDGDLIMFFLYMPSSMPAKNFYLAKIDIPSGMSVYKERFTAKKIHLKKDSCIMIDRSDLSKAKFYDGSYAEALREGDKIVVRKCTEEEHRVYSNILAMKKLKDSIKASVDENFIW